MPLLYKLGVPPELVLPVLNCAACHRLVGVLYAVIFTTEPLVFDTRLCVRAWMAAHPDGSDREEGPE